MIPAIFLFFFIPALLTTPTHPYALAAKIPVYSSILPDIHEIERVVAHITNHVHKYGLIRVYTEHEIIKRGYQLKDKNFYYSGKWTRYNPKVDHERGLCFFYSFYIVDELTKFGYKAHAVGNRQHAYVEVWTTEGIVIVDATYRQFFPYRDDSKSFELWRMPEVLVVNRRYFEKTLYSFPIFPRFGAYGYGPIYGNINAQSGNHWLSEEYLWACLVGYNPTNGIFFGNYFNVSVL